MFRCDGNECHLASNIYVRLNIDILEDIINIVVYEVLMK